MSTIAVEARARQSLGTSADPNVLAYHAVKIDARR